MGKWSLRAGRVGAAHLLTCGSSPNPSVTSWTVHRVALQQTVAAEAETGLVTLGKWKTNTFPSLTKSTTRLRRE